MLKKIRIGIIGAGQIARSHLMKYQEIPDAEVVAVCDINETILNQVCVEYNIPNRYTNFRKMLERDDLDAVDVCLHNNYHMAARPSWSLSRTDDCSP